MPSLGWRRAIEVFLAPTMWDAWLSQAIFPHYLSRKFCRTSVLCYILNAHNIRYRLGQISPTHPTAIFNEFSGAFRVRRLPPTGYFFHGDLPFRSQNFLAKGLEKYC